MKKVKDQMMTVAHDNNTNDVVKEEDDEYWILWVITIPPSKRCHNFEIYLPKKKNNQPIVAGGGMLINGLHPSM